MIKGDKWMVVVSEAGVTTAKCLRPPHKGMLGVEMVFKFFVITFTNKFTETTVVILELEFRIFMYMSNNN